MKELCTATRAPEALAGARVSHLVEAPSSRLLAPTSVFNSAYKDRFVQHWTPYDSCTPRCRSGCSQLPTSEAKKRIPSTWSQPQIKKDDAMGVTTTQHQSGTNTCRILLAGEVSDAENVKDGEKARQAHEEVAACTQLVLLSRLLDKSGEYANSAPFHQT